MAKVRFDVDFFFGDCDEELEYGVIELDQEVIDRVNDEWRSRFYKLHTPEDVASHIARNLAIGLRLHQLDGWADLSDDMAELIEKPDLRYAWSCEARKQNV